MSAKFQMPLYTCPPSSTQQSVFLDTNCKGSTMSGFDSGHISGTDASSPSSLSDLNILSDSAGSSNDSVLGSTQMVHSHNSSNNSNSTCSISTEAIGEKSVHQHSLPNSSRANNSCDNNPSQFSANNYSSNLNTNIGQLVYPNESNCAFTSSQAESHQHLLMQQHLQNRFSAQMPVIDEQAFTNQLLSDHGFEGFLNGFSGNMTSCDDHSNQTVPMNGGLNNPKFHLNTQQLPLQELFSILEISDNNHTGLNGANSILQKPMNLMKENQINKLWSGSDQNTMASSHSNFQMPASRRAITGCHNASMRQQNQLNGQQSFPLNGADGISPCGSNPRSFWNAMPQQQQQQQQYLRSNGISNNQPLSPWSQALANQKLGLAPTPVNSMNSFQTNQNQNNMSGISPSANLPLNAIGQTGLSGKIPQRQYSDLDSGLGLDQLASPEITNAVPPMFHQSQQQSGMLASIGFNQNLTDERFSRKVFVGGLPPDIDEEEITASFRRFGNVAVDWPHKAESKSYFPPKGYCFLLFQDEMAVQHLTDACIVDDGKYYWCVSSATIKDKPVQIRPWCLNDSDFVMDDSQPLDPRKTIFVGGVPRPLKAIELAMIMNRLYGGVCYAGIDTDPELKYPKGAGRVAFSNQQSYIAAISARFVQLQHSDIDKRVEVKPYVLDDQMCDECQGARCQGKFAPFFCSNVTCLQYYCELCWAHIHSRPGREYHKPLVKEGADRPRTVPFRW